MTALGYARSRHTSEPRRHRPRPAPARGRLAHRRKAMSPWTFVNPVRYYRAGHGRRRRPSGERGHRPDLAGPLRLGHDPGRRRLRASPAASRIHDLAVTWDEERSEQSSRSISDDDTSSIPDGPLHPQRDAGPVTAPTRPSPSTTDADGVARSPSTAPTPSTRSPSPWRASSSTSSAPPPPTTRSARSWSPAPAGRSAPAWTSRPRATSSASTRTPDPTPADLRDHLTEAPYQDGVRDTGGKVTLAIHACPKPVIAAINGAAVGIGATMTLAMDLRLASTRARIGFVFGRLGIVPEACSS